MTKIRRAAAMLAVWLTAVGVGAQTHPVFWNRPADYARWQTWKAAYDAAPAAPATVGGQLYKLAKENAECACRYFDNGSWPAWMYHVTRDPKYVALAWTKIQEQFLSKTDAQLAGDYIQNHGPMMVLAYDWLYPGLTQAQRDIFLAKLNVGANNQTGGARMIDSDQTGGEWALLAMLHVATASYNPTIVTVWNDAARKIGGWTATASDMKSTRRNAMKRYAELAAGGDWIESSEYNLGIGKRIVLPFEALKSTGMDAAALWPEYEAWKQEGAEAFIHQMTPDFKGSYKWGDSQDSDSVAPYYRLESCMSFAGATIGTQIGPYVNDYCLKWIATSTIKQLDPVYRGYYVFDPDAPRADYASLPLDHVSPGTGIVQAATGWNATASYLGFQFAQVLGVDHNNTVFGEFQFYKNGAWAIRHPITYGGPSIDNRGGNGLTLAGYPAYLYGMQEYRGPLQTTIGSDFVYAAATSGGFYGLSGQYYINKAIPNSAVQEMTRSLVWLKDLDTIVTFDRGNVKPQIPGAGTPALMAWSTSRPLKESYVHSPIAPTVTGDYLEWPYSATGRTRVTTLLPTDATKTVEDLKTVWVTGYYGLGTVAETQKKWQTRIVPPDRQWDTFLNVWDVYDSTPATVALVRDVANHVDGAVVTKAGKTYVMAFNATQGPDIPNLTPSGTGTVGVYSGQVPGLLEKVRFRKTGYTLAIPPQTTTLPWKVLLFDLDPTVGWHAGSQTLIVNAQGVAVLTVPAGTVNLTVSAGGVTPPPPWVCPLTVPKCAAGVTCTSAGDPHCWIPGAEPDTCVEAPTCAPPPWVCPLDMPKCGTGVTCSDAACWIPGDGPNTCIQAPACPVPPPTDSPIKWIEVSPGVYQITVTCPSVVVPPKTDTAAKKRSRK